MAEPPMHPSQLAQARWELLTMANEDAHGLYEAVWTMNAMFPELSPDDRRSLAKEMIRQLLSEGLLCLCIDRWIATDQRDRRGRQVFRIEAPRIKDADVDRVLDDSSNWEPYGPHDEGIAFHATDKGEAAYLTPNPI